MQGLMQDFQLTVPMILRRFMQFTPDRPVVTAGPTGPHRHTWGQIGERTMRLANALQDMGLKKSDRVATFAWNTHRHLELYYAPCCAGMVLHTLNIRLFPDQLTYIVKHADDKVIFVDASLTPLLARVVDQLDCVEKFVVMNDGAPVHEAFADAIDYEELLAAASPEFSFPNIDEDLAAAMCYTSGTTGNPKGVVYSHRSTVLHAMGSMYASTLGVLERDVVLPVVPMFHAGSWGLPYACGLSGASVVLPGSDMSGQALAKLIESEKVTIAAGVPTIWVGLEAELSSGKYDIGSLRAIICGGSAVPEAMIRRFDALGLKFIHAWGMTETSPLGSTYTITTRMDGETEDQRFARAAMQGVVVPGVEIRLTDDDGTEQPWDGESVGEIEVRGPWIASAYYDPDDDANTSKFRDGWLRTGDVATIDDLGFIKITDRTKDLVKSGGEWISSVELEGTLMAHPAVLEATVIGVPHPKWDERPLAIVVKREGAEVTAHELIEFLSSRVAKWWLPDAIEFVDEIPKTSVGKFDKKVVRAKYAEYQLPTA